MSLLRSEKEKTYSPWNSYRYYSNLPYNKAAFPKIPRAKHYSTRHEEHYLEITRLSCFRHRASHNSSSLHNTLGNVNQKTFLRHPTYSMKQSRSMKLVLVIRQALLAQSPNLIRDPALLSDISCSKSLPLELRYPPWSFHSLVVVLQPRSHIEQTSFITHRIYLYT